MNDQIRGRFAWRALASVGVASLALMSFAAVGSAAYGVDEPTTPQVANIDPQATGTITLHKYQEIGSATQLNPAGPPPASGYTPLAGVEFTLYSVPGLSVTNPDDWSIFNTLTYDSVSGEVSGTGFGPVTPTVVETDTTDPMGTIVFDGAGEPGPGLGLGVYLVIEGNSGTNLITKKAEPFFVTVPLPNNNEWLYNVHVYPKNSVGSISKTVDSTNVHKVGDTVLWPVTITIPTLPNGENYLSFSVSDVLDSRLDNLAIDSVTINGVPVTYTETGSAGQLMVVNPDLAAVNAAKGMEIVVTISSRIASLGADGVISNTAFVHLPGGVNLPSNSPSVRLGALQIDKFAAGTQGVDTTKPLNGASFALYLTEAEATAALTGTVGTPVWTGTITSGGTITTPGLYVGDSVNNAASRDYYLVETQAPAGYTRTATVIPVTVQVSGETAVTIVQVGNPQRPPVELPLTGSAGTAMFLAGGLGLILLAGGASVLAIRRRQGASEE